MSAVSCGSGDSAVRGVLVSRRGLLARLDGAARVTQIAAPPGSGKTVLLRSWIAESDLAEHVAWVSVPGDEHDPQRFWPARTAATRP